MSWANELYHVYETQHGQEHSDLLLVSQSIKKTQIEVILNADGTFETAYTLYEKSEENEKSEKKDKEKGKSTIILVTEGSAARTSNICPMPFADGLCYVAGDFPEYVEVDKKCFSKDEKHLKYYDAYIKQLQCWHESKHSHPAVDVLYTYLTKETLMHDLKNCHIFELNEKKEKLTEKYKIVGTEIKKAFVRFRINGLEESETWNDKTLYDAFIAWYGEKLNEHIDFCYATGKLLPVAEKHPRGIRNDTDGAKLISSDDSDGFTYRGRFIDAQETLRVSYDFSQKMHNALKWLIQRQGIFFDSLVIVVWASTLQPLPDILDAGLSENYDEYLFQDETPIVPDTMKEYRDILKKIIFGNKSGIELHNNKVMLLGVDSATRGRLSVSFYEEMKESEFLSNLLKWHEETACRRYNRKKKKYQINSFSVYDILNCAFGTEEDLEPKNKKETLKKHEKRILRLIPCITESRPLPTDIMWALYRKASNPMAYKDYRNHNKVLQTACGIIYKYYIDRKEKFEIMYNPEETDRSYLYGCLLAVADAAERAAYDENEDKRVTNARRYWSAFSNRPCQTWLLIRDHLQPYFNKLGIRKSTRYEKMLSDIMSKFDYQSFENDSALSPSYLLGYYHYTGEIYKK